MATQTKVISASLRLDKDRPYVGWKLMEEEIIKLRIEREG